VADTLAGEPAILLAHLHRDERRIGRSPPGPEPAVLRPGEASRPPLPSPGWSNASPWSSPPARRGRWRQALSSKVLVITGGPGVGKDHPDQRDPAHHGGQEATHPALRSHRPGRQADGRNHRARGQKPSTGCWSSTRQPSGSSARPSCRWSAICWWWMRPRWWNVPLMASLLDAPASRGGLAAGG